VLGGEMNPDKVMEDPVDIEALLEALFLFGIGVGFSAIGRTPPAQGGIEGFQMIGMDLGVLNRRRGVRMLPARGLIFRPLAAALIPTSATRAKKIGKLLILQSRIFKGRHYKLDFLVRR
jgi:hypothetical protein